MMNIAQILKIAPDIIKSNENKRLETVLNEDGCEEFQKYDNAITVGAQNRLKRQIIASYGFLITMFPFALMIGSLIWGYLYSFQERWLVEHSMWTTFVQAGWGGLIGFVLAKVEPILGLTPTVSSEPPIDCGIQGTKNTTD